VKRYYRYGVILRTALAEELDNIQTLHFGVNEDQVSSQLPEPATFWRYFSEVLILHAPGSEISEDRIGSFARFQDAKCHQFVNIMVVDGHGLGVWLIFAIISRMQ
jgi:hypothetical protein